MNQLKHVGMTIVAQEYERCAKMQNNAHMIKTTHNMIAHKKIFTSAIKSTTYERDSQTTTEYTIDGIEYFKSRQHAWWEEIRYGVKTAHKTAVPFNDREFNLFEERGVANFVFVCERKNW